MVFSKAIRASTIFCDSKINLSHLGWEKAAIFFPAKLILTPSLKMILARHALQQTANVDLHLAFLQNIFTSIRSARDSSFPKILADFLNMRIVIFPFPRQCDHSISNVKRCLLLRKNPSTIRINRTNISSSITHFFAPSKDPRCTPLSTKSTLFYFYFPTFLSSLSVQI